MIEGLTNLQIMNCLLKMFEMRTTKSILEKQQTNLSKNRFKQINLKKNLQLLQIQQSSISNFDEPRWWTCKDKWFTNQEYLTNYQIHQSIIRLWQTTIVSKMKFKREQDLPQSSFNKNNHQDRT